MAGKDQFSDNIEYQRLPGSPTSNARNNRPANQGSEKIDVSGLLADIVPDFRSEKVSSLPKETSQDPEFQRKKAFMLEERARALASQSKFYEAATMLEEIVSSDESVELGVKLLMAECYMQLGRENKANRTLKDIRKIILSPPHLNVDEIIALGEEFKSETSFVRSMILFRLASDIFKSSNLPPDDVIDGIFRCIAKARKAIEIATESGGSQGGELGKLLLNLGQLLNPTKSLDAAKLIGQTKLLDPAKLAEKAIDSNKKPPQPNTRLRVIVLDLGIEYMTEMLEDMRSVQNADIEKKTLKEAWAASHIGYHLASLEEFTKSYKIRKAGADAMERQFGSHASSYKVYGVLLHNMGVVLHNSQKYKEAEAVYIKALESKEKALDYDDSEKPKDIDVTRNALKNTRRHMK